MCGLKHAVTDVRREERLKYRCRRGRKICLPAQPTWASGDQRESAEQRGKKSAESSEKPARRGVIHRCRFSASRFCCLVRGWRKRSSQSRCCPRTRIERQRTDILNRRRWRTCRVEHERRLNLHVQFVRRTDAQVQGQRRCRGHTFRGRRFRPALGSRSRAACSALGFSCATCTANHWSPAAEGPAAVDIRTPAARPCPRDRVVRNETRAGRWP